MRTSSTAEIETVAEVESRGEAFYDDGFPVILFERHKFRKFTEGKFNKSHPAISGPAGNYGKPGQNQQNKFNRAFALDPIAAMKSCSWGKFQIMGFNYAMCGYDSVGDFVDAMKESEGKQFDAFVNFVISAGLADELRAHKWEAFAEGYNGPDYKKNDYHNKLPKAFAKFSKRKIHCGEASATAPAVTLPAQSDPMVKDAQTIDGASTDLPDPAQSPIDSEEPSPIVEEKTTETVGEPGKTVSASLTTTTPAGDPPGAKPTLVSKNGPLAKWLLGGGLATVGTYAWNYVQSNPSAVGIAIICATLLIVVFVFRGTITDMVRMQTAADPDKKNVS